MAQARRALETIIGQTFPAGMSDEDALLRGIGRRAPDAAQREELRSGPPPVMLR